MKGTGLTMLVMVAVLLAGCVPTTAAGVGPISTARPPAVGTVAAVETPWRGDAAGSCVVDLEGNSHDCQGVQAVEVLFGPEGGQVALRINLEGSRARKARFDIDFGELVETAAANWTVNIGDSMSNNGWAGDAGDQSNDAEVQVANADLAAYGRDGMPPEAALDGRRQLLDRLDVVMQTSRRLMLEIGNEYVRWDNYAGEAGELTSPYLFALDGQPDGEGAVNYDIYATFNRTISGGRVGGGVSRVVVEVGR